MKKFLVVLFINLFLSSCSNKQLQNTKTNLSATEFSDKIKALPTSPIIDVRTPEEFEKGHLENALNYNWKNEEFAQQVATLDKGKPVFVYCLSGGRSSAAANKLREDGFKEVYELDGGIMKWRATNLPETTTTAVAAATTELTKQQFDELTKSDKLVLIDFYADWCGPCKKMQPHLEEISKEMADKVQIIRINVDENPTLSKELAIEALPTLQLYKAQKLTWNNIGYLDKQAIISQLK